MFNKRTHIRFLKSGNVNIAPEGNTANIFKGELIDIGFRGFSAYLKEKIDLDTIVQFELITKLWERPLIGKGKIRYIAQIKRYGAPCFRVGLEFIDINKDSIVTMLNQIRNKICKEKRKKIKPKPSGTSPYDLY